MRKLLLSAGLLVASTVTAHAADFGVEQGGCMVYYNIVDAAAKTCEIAPNPDGKYNLAFSVSNAITSTVTNPNDGETYTLIGFGENCFKDGSIKGNNVMTELVWFPSGIQYIKAGAFDGTYANMPSIRFADMTYVDPKAFINNRINRLNPTGQGNGYLISGSTGQGKTSGCELYVEVDGVKKLLMYPGERYDAAYKRTATASNANYVLTTSASISDYGIVGDYAFYGNKNIKAVNFSTSLTEIGAHAFENTVIESLNLPATLTTVGEDAFKGNLSITSVKCLATTPPSGAVFEDAVYAKIRENGNITVPEGSEDAYLADKNWVKFWVEPKCYLAGDFTNWADGKLEMESDGRGGYTITVEGVTSGQEFKIIDTEGNWLGGDAAQGETSYGVHKDWCTDIALSTTGSNFKITGSGNLTFAVSADMKLTVSGWATGIYLVGSMTSWLDNKEEMAYSDGVFTITREMEADAEFKFYDQGTATWYGTNEAATKTITADMLGTTLTVATPGENFKMENAGNWVIVFDQDNMTLNVTEYVEPLEDAFKYGQLWYQPVSQTEVEIAPIPSGATYNVALSDANELTATVTSPSTEKEYTVVGIGAGAFKNGTINCSPSYNNTAKYMRYFFFPATVTYIGAEAFNGTSSNYPGIRFGSITTVDETAFINNKINWFNTAFNGSDDEHPYKVYGDGSQTGNVRGGELYKEVSGVKTLVCYPGDRHKSHWIQTPSGSNSNYTQTYAAYADNFDVIGKNAFYGNTNITSVTFGSTLTAIEEDAFKNVSQLRTINLPAANPPSVATDFENAVYANGTLNLSGDAASNVEAYYNHEIWGKFFHDVTIADATGGTVTASALYGVKGATITLTVTPNSGYEFGSITVTTDAGGTVTVSGSNGTYTFTMPTADVTVTATFSMTAVELTGVEFSDGHEYATWYGEFDLTLPADVKAYVVSAVSGDEATIAEVPYIPAATGVLLYSEAEASNLSTVAYDGTTDEVTSLLVGYNEDTAITDGYLLWGDAFYRALAGTLPAHRCYLPVPEDEPSPVSRVRLVQAGNSVITGIADVNTVRAGRVTYVSVTGQTSDRPFSGVNIVIASDGTVSKMIR